MQIIRIPSKKNRPDKSNPHLVTFQSADGLIVQQVTGMISKEEANCRLDRILTRRKRPSRKSIARRALRELFPSLATPRVKD